VRKPSPSSFLKDIISWRTFAFSLYSMLPKHRWILLNTINKFKFKVRFCPFDSSSCNVSLCDIGSIVIGYDDEWICRYPCFMFLFKTEELNHLGLKWGSNDLAGIYLSIRNINLKWRNCYCTYSQHQVLQRVFPSQCSINLCVISTTIYVVFRYIMVFNYAVTQKTSSITLWLLLIRRSYLILYFHCWYVATT